MNIILKKKEIIWEEVLMSLMLKVIVKVEVLKLKKNLKQLIFLKNILQNAKWVKLL